MIALHMIALSRALQQCALTLGGHDQAMGIYESAANNPGIVSCHIRHVDPVFITALLTARTTQERAATTAKLTCLPKLWLWFAEHHCQPLVHVCLDCRLLILEQVSTLELAFVTNMFCKIFSNASRQIPWNPILPVSQRTNRVERGTLLWPVHPFLSKTRPTQKGDRKAARVQIDERGPGAAPLQTLPNQAPRTLPAIPHTGQT